MTGEIEIWEWTDEEVWPGYILWRMVIPGFDKQLCVDEAGYLHHRPYDPDGEEEMWTKRT